MELSFGESTPVTKYTLLFLSLALAGCSSVEELDSWKPISDTSYAQLEDADGDGVIIARDDCMTTELGREVSNRGCSPEEEQKVSNEYIIDFSNSQTELTGAQLDELNRFLAELPKGAKWKVHLEGYAPASGDLLYNQVQAEARVGWLSDYLNSHESFVVKQLQSSISPGESETDEEYNPLTDQLLNDKDADGVVDALDQCADTNFELIVDKNGCPEIVSRVIQTTLTVRYPVNGSEIAPVYLPKVKELANFINKYGVKKVEVIGHTSATGSADYNQVLSERRAQSVKDMLASDYNIPPEVLIPIGKGESVLLNADDSPQANSLNRRVEIAINEILTVERKKADLNGGSALSRKVKLLVETDTHKANDRWHIFIMENQKNSEDLWQKNADEEDLGW